MRPPFRLLTSLLAGLLLAGCSTTAPTSPATQVPSTGAAAAPAVALTPAPTPVPVPAADLTPATLKGSEESSTLLDNFTAFVRAVDGQPIAAGRKGWNQPISLPPGLHRLSVEFMRGSFYARTELTLEAKPAAAYELRQANDAQVYGGHTFCEFWIVDLATGEKITAPKRVAIEKVKTGG